MNGPAVLVEQLRVTYRTTLALDGVDLAAPGGTILGVLGHNGAGKTTLIRVMSTLVRPSAGRVVIDGFDAVADAAQVRRRIGLTGQYAGLDDFLTGRENLELVARLTGLGTRAQKRADALIDRLALHDIASRRVGELSGGSRRRIDLAASLVGSPSVLFLDEPTTGLDPTARSALWDALRELTAAGTTVVLTTQYLEEADRLADDIVVLDNGRVAARGTPAQLKELVGGKVVNLTIGRAQTAWLPWEPDFTRSTGADHQTVSYRMGGADAATDLVAALARRGVDVVDLEVVSPSLDDVFSHLSATGVPA